MKKILALIVLSAMTVSFFSACGKPDILKETDNSDIDFLGETIKVYMNTWTGQVEKKGGSASSDREYDRIIDTQDKFNFKFEYVRVSSVSNSFLAGSLSGGIRADLMKEGPLEIYNAYAINTLKPAENVVNDASQDKWKAAGQSDSETFNGIKYGVFPNYWENAPSICGFINLNLTIMDSYDIQPPYDIIEAGEWDWEHFRAFLRQTAFVDGTQTWRGLGMIITWGETMLPFILGNGGSYITYSNGKYKAAIDSEEAIEALEFAQTLVEEDILSDIPSGYDLTSEISWMIYSSYISASSEEEIEPIRYPYGPHGNKDTVSAITKGDVMYAFPIFSAYTDEELGAVAEYMFEPLSDIYPNGWKDIYEDTVFFNHEDFVYYLHSVEEATYLDEAALSYSHVKFGDAMRLVLNGSATPEAAIESVIDILQADIDEHYNK